MALNKHFRVMGYIYTGLCLTGSFLMIINSSNTVKSNSHYDERVSAVSIVVLIVSLISLVFNAFLTFGMLMHRVEFIKYHLRFVSTIYVLIFLGLFIGCIVGGIVLGNSAADANGVGAAAIAFTSMIIFLITFVTLQFTLIVWILKGVMRVIAEDMMRLVTDDVGELA